MKKITASVLLLAILFSCKKHATFEEMRAEAEKKLFGKWAVDSMIRKDYQPVTYLINSDTVYGSVSDSIIFHTSLVAAVYTNFIAANASQPYILMNPGQLIFGENLDNIVSVWEVGKLSAKEMILFRGVNNAARNTRFEETIFLKKI